MRSSSPGARPGYARRNIFSMKNTWTESAPDYWAGYLINGDPGDMTDAEIEHADAWLSAMGGVVVDAANDPHFTRFDGMGCTCITYTLKTA